MTLAQMSAYRDLKHGRQATDGDAGHANVNKNSDARADGPSAARLRLQTLDVTGERDAREGNVRESNARESNVDNRSLSDEDPGAAMLLMMRRSKGKVNASLPAPLSKAAIKTTVLASEDASKLSVDFGRGLPSSHPYYRSTRVLASPSNPRNRSDKAGNGTASMSAAHQKAKGQDRRPPNVVYEQQRPRPAGVVYSYPLRPPGQGRSNSWNTTKEAVVSPRVYIPPPIFSPRRGPSRPSHATHSSSNRAMGEQLSRSYSVASERFAGDLIINEIPASPRQTIGLPYRTANPALRAQRRHQLPSYTEYFGDEQEAFLSPIRESFVRSSNDSRETPSSWDSHLRKIARRDSVPSVHRTTPSSDPARKAYDSATGKLKRPMPEEFGSRFPADPRYRGMLRHLEVPQGPPSDRLQSAPAKRVRTISAESDTKRNGALPPDALRYIAPPHCKAGNLTVPHTAAGVLIGTADEEGQVQVVSSKASSPAALSQIGSSSRRRGSSISDSEASIASIVTQAISERAGGGVTETARALVEVAAALAKVAESLKDKI